MISGTALSLRMNPGLPLPMIGAVLDHSHAS